MTITNSTEEEMEGYPIFQKEEDVKAKAVFHNLTPFFAEPNELLLDIDDTKWEDKAEWVQKLYERNPAFLRVDYAVNILCHQWLYTRSKNGKLHIYIRLAKPVSDSERIAIQAVLGSDPKREALSIGTILIGSQCPTVLFETEEEAKKVVEWRNQFQSIAVS